MVKKVMRPPCGSTLGGRPVAPCSALCPRGNPPVVQPLEKAEHFLFLDGFSLDGSARRTLLHRLPGESDPRSIQLHRRWERRYCFRAGIPLWWLRRGLNGGAPTVCEKKLLASNLLLRTNS